MTNVSVDLGDPMAQNAKALLQASHNLMQELFPADANHFLSIEALCQPEIRFFLADANADTVGCAALVNCGTYGEVKSMFVASAARGKGIADKLLDRLLEEARTQRLPWLKLETGVGLDAAHRLYERNGFTRCAAFGDYAADAPYSIYMEREL
ncbi:putative acetyltransferase [Sedimentitalea nanhaiensis]|uniref:Putative acetyltransferase n=2 Tax=Sedimentitalea nanhaiensis TaxID=999627 RepID=A0A1I7A1C3_9RHOB|nr:putative acetyltransferase [Sedimentitalea nanhaiensis]